VTIPDYLDEITLKAGIPLEEIKRPQIAPRAIDLTPLIADLKAKIDHINNQIGDIQSLPESRQVEFLELLKQANLNIDEIKIRDNPTRK